MMCLIASVNAVIAITKLEVFRRSMDKKKLTLMKLEAGFSPGEFVHANRSERKNSAL